MSLNIFLPLLQGGEPHTRMVLRQQCEVKDYFADVLPRASVSLVNDLRGGRDENPNFSFANTRIGPFAQRLRHPGIQRCAALDTRYVRTRLPAAQLDLGFGSVSRRATCPMKSDPSQSASLAYY